nr:Arm DNA-binding domain-containing protein [Roseospira visakhapatnamensis]
MTARGVRTLTTPGCHADGGGLYLRISAAGNKTWEYRFQIAGRRRHMGLGRVDDVSLANARELAGAARRLNHHPPPHKGALQSLRTHRTCPNNRDHLNQPVDFRKPNQKRVPIHAHLPDSIFPIIPKPGMHI